MLEELSRTDGCELLAIGGPRPELPRFLDFLPSDLRGRVAGTFTVDEATFSVREQQASAIVGRYERSEEERLVAETLETAAAGGLAAARTPSLRSIWLRRRCASRFRPGRTTDLLGARRCARQQRHVAPLRAMCFPIEHALPWPTVVSGWNGDKAPGDWRSHHRTVAYRAQQRPADGVRGQGRHTVLGIELKFGPVRVGVGHDVVVDNGPPVRLRATELHPIHRNVRDH